VTTDDRGRLDYKDSGNPGEITSSDEGKVLADTSVPSDDGGMSVEIPKGTTVLDKNGQPVGEIGVESIDGDDVSGYDGGVFSFTGKAYECSPGGATFSPAVDLVFTFTEEEWEQFDGATPSVMYYNPKTKEWEEVETTYDPETRTVTASVTHFSKYAVFAKNDEAPAAAVAAETPVASVTPVTSGEETAGAGGSSAASGVILAFFMVGLVGVFGFGAYWFKKSRMEEEVFRDK
jgi:hypothetical protein